MARHHDLPADEHAVAALAARGLTYALVDPADPQAYAPWSRAANRGFLGADPEPEFLEQGRLAMLERRHVGVFDPAIAHPEVPVATVNSWPTALAVPGERLVEGWAISAVTVAPTHRRRGIARELLEAELRTAAAAGCALAMLTVSESGIYGRFGFASAAQAATWRIDTRRVTWTGPTPHGRVEFISHDEYLADAMALHTATLEGQPGEIAMWLGRWQQRAGVLSDDSALARKTRAIRYVDPDGVTRGVATYRLSGGDDDFTSHSLEVSHLWAPDPRAHAALWRFLLEHDLVTEVIAHLMRVDDPLRWSIGDWRAATVTVADHQYLRILDVPAAFTARGYDGAGAIAFDVDDPAGFASGRWVLHVADGRATVEQREADGIPTLSLGVAELSALYLGGVRASDLVFAGRAREVTPGSARAVDAVLHSLVEPSLSGWY
jgi:predicted acetyltransferase